MISGWKRCGSVQRNSFKTDSGLREEEENVKNLGGLLHFSSLVFELRSSRSENPNTTADCMVSDLTLAALPAAAAAI